MGGLWQHTFELPDVLMISLTAISPRCLLRQPTMIRMMMMLTMMLMMMMVTMMMMMMMMMISLPAATAHDDQGTALGKIPSSLDFILYVEGEYFSRNLNAVQTICDE